jgi:tetratricopeptide (TPR) repeat protein
MSRPLRVLCLAALLLGIVWNFLFAVADWYARRNDPQTTRLAMKWMPENAAFTAQLADEVYASDPPQAKALLASALQRNRWNAAGWIHLALLHEAEGDRPGAEAALLRAADVDATFLPKWSLANFYFRQNNTAQFWHWAEKATAVVPDDPTALFRLAWYIKPEARAIEDRLRIHSPTVQAQFVNFLVSQGDPQSVSDAASRLAAMSPRGDSRDTLLQACDWLLAQRRPDLALRLWKLSAQQSGYPPSQGDSPVTNADFSHPTLAHGFDWRLSPVEGVTSAWNDASRSLEFEFSGNQAEHLVLMTEIVPLRPGTSYALAVDYTTSGIAPGSGIRWYVSDLATGRQLAQTDSLAGGQGSTASACFVTPPAGGFAELALGYQRAPGTTRVEGKLTLRKVRLEPAGCQQNEKGGSKPSSADGRLKKTSGPVDRSST